MRRRRPVTLSIIPGEVTVGDWCTTCNLRSRVRLPLYSNTGPAPVAVLQMCAYCGTGHLPHIDLASAAAADRPPRRGPAAAALWALHRRQCARAARPARECAYGKCRRPGWYGCAWPLPGDDGTTWLLFCGRRHRRRWSDPTDKLST